MKIEPKYEDGEPICAMYVDCPFYDFNHDIQDHCTKLANEAVYDGSPCIPALRRDRDQAIKERDYWKERCKNADLKTWRKEDEIKALQREICEIEAASRKPLTFKPQVFAKSRGWDCFEGGE